MNNKRLFGCYKFGHKFGALIIFGFTLWAHHIKDGFWWVRIFGKGIFVKDITKFPLLFSERNGYAKRMQIGKWSIKWLS